MYKNDLKIVDCVILTYKPSYDFVLLLNKLINQDYKINKIFIINTEEKYFYINFDSDQKKELLNIINDERIDVINIEERDFDHGATRNLIINYSNADYIVYFTSDSIPYNNDLITNLVNGFSIDKKIKVSYARHIAKDNATYKEKLVREFNYPDKSILKSADTINQLGIKNYFSSNVCAIYDFKYFKDVKGFTENIILNEDSYYAYKVINDGYKVYYNADAKVLHSHNYSYIKQFKRYFDIGVSHNKDKEIFKNVSVTKEGTKLFKRIAIIMLQKFRIISLIDFIIDMIFRYMGFEKGKKYKNLTLNACLKYTLNKNYFLRNKNV